MEGLCIVLWVTRNRAEPVDVATSSPKQTNVQTTAQCLAEMTGEGGIASPKARRFRTHRLRSIGLRYPSLAFVRQMAPAPTPAHLFLKIDEKATQQKIVITSTGSATNRRLLRSTRENPPRLSYFPCFQWIPTGKFYSSLLLLVLWSV